MTNQFEVFAPAAAPAPFFLMSTPPDPSAEDDSDELADLLDETGEITNRSNGKTGTDTKAEPDTKPKPS